MSEDSGARLKTAIVVASALISISHSIRVFTSKWLSIRLKLDDLFSHLSAIENCDSFEILSISIILDAILVTLKQCEELANLCLESSYSGKLLMQSDLDIICVKLDSHIWNLSDFYATGLLTQSNALVVSRPSVTASKDDMGFYLNDLLSRLKIGSNEMKKQALFSFNEVIDEDVRYVKIALELDGFVSLVVKFLDSTEEGIRVEAAKAVSIIAGSIPGKNALLCAGIIAPLVRVIESLKSSEQSKQYATRCLMKVTENSDNAWAVSAHGGVTALLKICKNGSKYGSELVALACGVLKNVAGVEEIRRFIVEEGAIFDLVELAKCKDEASQIFSLDLLQTMAFCDESVRRIIFKEGGVRVLVKILDPRLLISTKTREITLSAIANTFISTENSIDLLLNICFMDHILYFLRHGEASVEELALKASFWLCGISEETKKAMGEAGFLPVLLKFLESKSFEIREMAAETLSNMLVLPKNQKKFMQNEENIGFLLRLLDPENTKSANKKMLLPILKSLMSSNTARKKLTSSGHLRSIEVLAEYELPEAKKDCKKANFQQIPQHDNQILEVLNHHL